MAGRTAALAQDRYTRNRDFILEEHPTPRSLLHNATLLINEEVTVFGLRLWGSPVTPLYGGAFGLSSAVDRRKLYADIPVGLDVLVTHSPPFGVLDSAPDGIHAGCRETSRCFLYLLVFHRSPRIRP